MRAEAIQPVKDSAAAFEALLQKQLPNPMLLQVYSLVSCATSSVTSSASSPNCSNSLAARPACRHLCVRVWVLHEWDCGVHVMFCVGDEAAGREGVAACDCVLLWKHHLDSKQACSNSACRPSLSKHTVCLQQTINYLLPATSPSVTPCCCVVPDTLHGGTRLG